MVDDQIAKERRCQRFRFHAATNAPRSGKPKINAKTGAVCTRSSSLQQPDIVSIDALTTPEDYHDQCQTDGHFGCSDHHRKECKDMPVHGPYVPCECDQRKDG